MKSDHVKSYFKKNRSKTVGEIAKYFNVSEKFISDSLDDFNYYLVASLNFENRYFLFMSVIEKVIFCTPEKLILNFNDFSNTEKDFLKNNGFKIL